MVSDTEDVSTPELVRRQLIRRIAAGSGVLDIPNANSSGSVPDRRGGGLSIVMVTTAGPLLQVYRQRSVA